MAVTVEEASVQTTNATATVIFTSPALVASSVMQIVAYVVGGDAAGATGAGYARTVLARRASTGAPVLVGNKIFGTDTETLTTLNLTWSVDTVNNTVRCLVTGKAGTVMNWRGYFQVIIP